MTNTNTKIIVRFQVEGLHCWPEAEALAPQVAFLSSPHRHIFHIEAKKTVTHDDRDIEIIMFKREMQDYLSRNFFNEEGNMCDFESRSCEMLANDLLEAFDLDECTVLEDNENGAVVTKE
jgi:hypothetical protein